jgi:hypothetical protein
VAIRMVYGYKVDSPDDRLVQAAEKTMEIFSDGALLAGPIIPF